MLETEKLEIVLANPRGFCAGVVRAIDIVELALQKYDEPIYVRHEIVHNKRVVDDLRAKGAVFVEDLDEVPPNAITIFSAHGVARRVIDHAGTRGLKTIDATCPLVAKVHKEGQRYAKQNYDVVLIGHLGHPEVEGTLGQIDGYVHVIDKPEDVASLKVQDQNRVSYITQTTLSVNDTRDVIAALKERFPNIIGPDTRDICYATQNRQVAVRALAQETDAIWVVGANNSSNSNRLREIAEDSGVRSVLINDAREIDKNWLIGVKSVGLTAGASAPETLVQEVINQLAQWFEIDIRELAGADENIHFKLPPALSEFQESIANAADQSRHEFRDQ